MSTTSERILSTSERILDGALRALARRGVQKLSMSDICDEAGVSRGTLYRYFKNKRDVLEAIGQHVENGYKEAMQQAIKARPDPEDRLRVVMDVIVHYSDSHPEAALVIDEEPEFALGFLRREFSNYLNTVRDALEPVLDAAPMVQNGALTRNQLAEIFLRIGMSAALLPSPQARKLPQRVAAMWDALNRKSR